MGDRAAPTIAATLASREVLLVLALSAAWYVFGVWYLLVYLEWYDPDTLSRLANAFYVLYSREPHLAAIGFVWPPLLGMAMLPLLLLTPWWPSLASMGLAAGALSAMAGALFVTCTFAIMRVGGLPRWACWAFAGSLWLNPMWWYASVNGLSEMPFLLLLLLSSWLVWRWLGGRGEYYVAILANGCICAAAVMIRYEMLAWAVAISAITLVGGFLAGPAQVVNSTRARVQRAEAYALAFGMPWVFVFLLWIFFNWQIVGNPVYFLTSAYSNVAQTGVDFASIENPILAPAVGSVGGAVWFVILRAAYLNPALFVCLVLSTVAALRGRWHGLALIAPALAVLVLDAALLYRATLNSLLRYHLFSVPATIVLMAWLYHSWVAGRAPALRHVSAGLVVLAGAVMATTSGLAMADPALGHGTREAFVDATTATPAHAFNADRELAAYVDDLDLPDGSVLVDSANGYGVIISSRRPKQFVINSDSDFAAVLAHPQGSVGYVALGATDNFDVIAATYPRLFQTGEPFGPLEREFDGAPRMGLSAPTVWRLYRVGVSQASPAPIAATESSVPSERPTTDGVSHASATLVGEPTVSPAAPVISGQSTAVAPSASDALLFQPTPSSVTPVASPGVPGVRVAAPRVLLDAQFAALGAGLGWPNTPGVAWPDTTGYRLTAGSSNRFVAVGAPVGSLSHSHLVVNGRFRKVGGPPGGGYGLIVSDVGPGPRDGINQDGNYFVLEVGDRGEIGIWRRGQNQWIDLVPWRPEPAVRQGAGSNDLEVRATLQGLAFNVNGLPVAHWVGSIPPEGAVGAFVGGDMNQGLIEQFTVTSDE